MATWGVVAVKLILLVPLPAGFPESTVPKSPWDDFVAVVPVLMGNEVIEEPSPVRPRKTSI